MKPINYGEIIEKAEARRAALEYIAPKLQAVYSQWGALCAAAHRISSVNADYKRLDSEASALLAQSVGVTEQTLRNGLLQLGQAVRLPDEQARNLLEALRSGAEARQLTALQKLVADHYQGGEFGHIENQDDAKDVGDGLFTFCINEAGDASDKSELIAMLNRAIDQLRSLVGELEDLKEAQEPCQACIALARTVMLDQVSFDRKPDCYGIRQITDDEGIEEWEGIRTSPDVAREEANDMMATGRGEIYEVVPLWTTPQPAQAQAGAVPLDEARRMFDAGWKAAARFCGREDVVTDGIIGFGACPQFEAAFAAAHGIKGDQHA